MRDSMLTDEQLHFLHDEKETLTSILLKLAEVGTPTESLNTLKKAVLQLDELFLLVFVGEFNAGKSALINAILGEKVLQEGVTPTTSRVTLLKWGDQRSEKIEDDGFAVVTYPKPLLKQLSVVDSPGSNALIRKHERLTDEFVPRSDLVLFTTSADRPLTESERQFLQRILAWGKKVVFILNKIDILENEAALEEVRSYILNNAAVTLGEIPEFFPVSAKLAQLSLATGDEGEKQRLKTASRLGELERFINETLDDTSRLQLKFQNPLGVAENLVVQIGKEIDQQAGDLVEDRQTVAALETAVAGYEKDLATELSPRLAEIENLLQKVELRGLDFFDKTLRLTNIHHLIKGEKIRAEFEKEVTFDLSSDIENKVQRLIDWLVEKDLREWQQVMVYLQKRQSVYSSQVVGNELSPQVIRRRELIDKVGASVKKIIESYDKTREASQLGKNVETAVAQTAMFEAGAVGLGVLVSSALLSSALDVTGIIAAGTLAVIGLFVIPYKRKQAKDNFREKINTMRTRLFETLTTTFETESGNAISRLKENIAPYTRFIHSETDRIEKTIMILKEVQGQLAALRAQIASVIK
jgi:small GTP-binding protein